MEPESGRAKNSWNGEQTAVIQQDLLVIDDSGWLDEFCLLSLLAVASFTFILLSCGVTYYIVTITVLKVSMHAGSAFISLHLATLVQPQRLIKDEPSSLFLKPHS